MVLRRFCDLDGTVIFSYRYFIENKVLVEKYNGKELSYMDADAYQLLQAMPKEEFVPVTSRTKEQYERIVFYKDGGFPLFALVDNGGILLVDGREDKSWTEETMTWIDTDTILLKRLACDFEHYGTIKMQDQMILFVKPFSKEDEIFIKKMVGKNPQLQIFWHGNKLYICSAKLTKGYAIRRFRKRFQTDYAVAAGDSFVDCTMAEETEKSFYSNEWKEFFEHMAHKVCFVNQNELAARIFSYTLQNEGCFNLNV